MLSDHWSDKNKRQQKISTTMLFPLLSLDGAYSGLLSYLAVSRVLWRVTIVPTGVLCCIMPIKRPLLGDRSLEDNATAKLLLSEDSGNDLIPSDSGLCGSNMGLHGKTKKLSK